MNKEKRQYAYTYLAIYYVTPRPNPSISAPNSCNALFINSPDGMAYNASPRRLSLAFATCCIIDLFGVFPIIALPRPIIDCGWFGIPLAFAVFGVQVYTAILLGRCWTIAERICPEIIQKNRYPYPAIADLALGRHAGKFVAVLLDVTIFGAGIPNLIIAAQNMQIIGLKVSEAQADISFCYWLLILGVLLCPIMWLGSPKDMKWLALISVGTVASVSILTWHCILNDPVAEAPIKRDPSWESFAIAYGILSFQFDIHPTILSVQMDMEQRDQLAQPILASFLITGGLFTITTSLAQSKYGSGANFNLLQGLPASSALYLDLTLVSMQIFLSMVIGTSAFFQDVEEKLSIPKEFSSRRCILRSILVLFLVLLGEAVPRFDLIMGLIGGCLTGPLMFILPPILYYKLKQKQELLPPQYLSPLVTETSNLLRRDIYFQNLIEWEYPKRHYDEGALSCRQLFVCAAVIAIGITATILATYFSVRNTFLYAELTPSCLMNFTAASQLIDL